MAVYMNTRGPCSRCGQVKERIPGCAWLCEDCFQTELKKDHWNDVRERMEDVERRNKVRVVCDIAS